MAKAFRNLSPHYHPLVPVEPGVSRGYLAKQVLGTNQAFWGEGVPARGTAKAGEWAAKLRIYKGGPVNKRMAEVAKKIKASPALSQQAALRDTPGLTLRLGPDEEITHLPKRSREIKGAIDDANKVVARHGADAVDVFPNALGQPVISAKRWLAAVLPKMRLLARDFS